MTPRTSKVHHGIGHSMIINFTGSILTSLVLFLSIPAYLHLVGEVRYGVLTLLWLLLTYLGALDLGIGRAATNRIAGLGNNTSERTQTVFWTAFTICLASGLAGSILLYFTAQALLDHFLATTPVTLRQELVHSLPWLILAPPITTVSSLFVGALQGKGAFMAMNVGQLTTMILYQLTPLVIAFSGYTSLDYLIPGMVGSRMVGALVLFLLCRLKIPLRSRPSFDPAEISPLLRYGGWISITNLAGPLLTVFDRFVIAAQTGAVSVTTYTVPFNLVNSLALLPASLQTVLLPRFAALREEEAQQLNVQASVVVMTLMTPMITALFFLINPILIFWVGQGLADRSTPVAHVLLMGVWLNAIAFIPFSFLQGRGRPDIPAKFHLLELFPYVVILWLLIHKFSIIGAAIAWSLRVFVDTLLLFAVTRQLQLFIKLSLISFAMFGAFSAGRLFTHDVFWYSVSGIFTVSASILVSLTVLFRQFGLHVFQRDTILFFFKQLLSKGNHE